MKILKIRHLLSLLLIIPLMVVVVYWLKNQEYNWFFYVNQSIGPNNKQDIFANLVFENNEIYFNSQNKYTYAINKDTGDINWKFLAQEYSPFPPLIDKDAVYISNFDGNIYKLNKENGNKVWQYTIGSNTTPDTPILLSEDGNTVFFGSRKGELFALDSATGKVIWKNQYSTIDTSKEFKLGTIHFGSIFIDDDVLYLMSSQEKKFISINARNGETNWQVSNIEHSFEKPIFINNKIILRREGSLLSVDKKSGEYNQLIRGNKKLVWRAILSQDDSEHILILDGETLSKYSVDLNNKIWEINGQIDDVIVSKNSFGPEFLSLKEGVFYAQKFTRTDNKNWMISIDYSNGNVLWKVEVNGWIQQQIIIGNNSYISFIDGKLISINNQTGSQNWSISNNGQDQKLEIYNDLLLLITENQSEYASVKLLDQKNGNVFWQYTTNRKVNNINDAYVFGERLYFLTETRKIIESLDLSINDPKQVNRRFVNFKFIENKSGHDPYLDIEEKVPFRWVLLSKFRRFMYLINNQKQINEYTLSGEYLDGIYQISIFHDEQLYENKFADLEVESIIEDENGEEMILKGFYYDNNQWKLRYKPYKAGQYKYKVSIRGPISSKTFEGNFYIDQVNSERIQVVDSNFTINGTRLFVPIGIQDGFFDRNFNGDRTDEMSESLLDVPTSNKEEFLYTDIHDFIQTYKRESAITLFRYGVDHHTPPLWQSLDHEKMIFDVNGGKFGDDLIHLLRQNDIKILMTIFGFYPPYGSTEEIKLSENKEVLKKYLDYLIARYGSLVDLWELTNEAEASLEWYEFVISYLRENDPYKLPISTNWEINAPVELDFQSIHWYNQIRSDNSLISIDQDFIHKKYGGINKPVLISEFGFKEFSWFEGLAEQMRVFSWLSIFRKMGIVYWTQGQNGIYKNKDNANIYLGPEERQYLKILSQFVPKDMSVPVTTETVYLDEFQAQLHLLKSSDYILGYLLRLNRDQNREVIFEYELFEKSLITWIDPKTGESKKQQLVGPGKVLIFSPKFEFDQAFIIGNSSEEGK